ncbi:lytic transglycosylase, partial [Streptomyces sp. SID11233]|nr:lytic transglycosylase [Streptomyces sp. SID11233]
GTSNDIYDPVANITAAANYAAERYGSMDNVNSAY